jgi:hypothetical protein
MSTIVFDTILSFIKESPVKHITAATVIYKALEVDSTILKDDLLLLSDDAIAFANIDKKSDRGKVLSKIHNQVKFQIF